MSKTAKRVLTILVITGILVLLALPKLKGLWSDKKAVDQKMNAPDAQPVEVSGMVITPDTVAKDVVIAGNVLPDEAVELRPEVSGRVVKINFQEGTHVHKGQLLVKINDADLQAQLIKLLSEKGVTESKLARTKQLLDKEAVSKEEYEGALNDLATVKSNIANLKAQIEKTSIYAPFDGTIGLRAISEGSFITPQNKISDLTRINPVKIDFAVPERYAGLVKPGSRIRFNIQGEPKYRYAEIYALEPRINETTRSLQVRARYPNNNNEIFPGSYAEVQLSVSTDRSAMMIPTESLVPKADEEYVYLLKNGKAAQQKVLTGIRTDTEVQITDGLQPGDTVITSGIIQLHPGAKVNFTIKEE